jgi:D-3-phosphoglycerate dehydrogenase
LNTREEKGNKMKPFIVVSDGFDKTLFEELKNINSFEVYPERKISQDKLMELLPKADGLVIRSATNFNDDLIEQAEKLKIIIRAGEGTDNIDKKKCKEKNIKVANTPGANNNSAAEHAFSLILSSLRKTPQANESMKSGKWEKSKFMGNELWKKTVGIIGFGRIGQILAKRLQGFEPNILFYDPFVKDSDIPNTKRIETIEEIFKQADVVSIHVPLMDATRNLISKSQLDCLKDNCLLVNASRGGIVKESDFIEFMQDERTKERGVRAAFDVFDTEPLPSGSKVTELDNVILTPHIGASTEEAQIRVGQMVIHQLKEFLLNKNLLNEVKS